MTGETDRRPDLDPDGREPRDQEPSGRIGTTGPGAIVGFLVSGLVLGWLVRPVAVHLHGSAPTVSWLPFVTLAFVAGVVGWLAWSTYRLLHRRRQRLAPHHAVNRLVLGKACALAGSLFAGGYFGYALSWLGRTEAALARQRVEHCVAAGIAAVLLVVGSLLLERACRIRRDDSSRGGPRRDDRR